MRKLRINNENLDKIIKVSKEATDNLTNAQSQIAEYVEDAKVNANNWVEKYYSLHIGKSYCCVDKNSSRYIISKTDSQGKTVTEFNDSLYYQDSVKKAKEWVKNQKDIYLKHLDGITGYVSPVLSSAQKVNESLKSVRRAKIKFDYTSYDIEKLYSDVDVNHIAEDTGFEWGYEAVIDKETNRKKYIKTLKTLSGDGKSSLGLNESVSCSVTELGAYSDNTVTVASMASSGKMSEDEIAKKIKEMNDDTEAAYNKLADGGFFAISSVEDIKRTYEEATGNEFDENLVNQEYNSVVSAYLQDCDEHEKSLYNSMAGFGAAGFGATAFMMNMIDNQGELTAEEKEKYGLNRVHHGPLSHDQLQEPMKDAPDLTRVHGSLNQSDETVYASRVLSNFGGFNNDFPATSLLGTPLLGDLDSLSGKLEDLTELGVPDKFEGLVESSQDIDRSSAQDYIDDYQQSEITENSGRLIEEYSSMTPQEKVSALQKLGYRDDVITDIVSNGTAGVTAYVIGQQNLNMSNVSAQMAMQQNTMPNMGVANNTYFKEMNISTSNGGNGLSNLSMQVQEARTSLNDAKVSYDNAITYANSAIDEANESKEEYTRRLQIIKRNSGDDPSKWSKEEIEEYNRVTNKYNRSVEKATKAAKDVEVVKARYDQKKATYEIAKSNYSAEMLNDIKGNGDSPLVSMGVPNEGSGNVLNNVESSIVAENNELNIGTPPSTDNIYNQTLVGVDESGKLFEETRVVSQNVTPDLNGVVIDGVGYGSTSGNAAYQSNAYQNNSYQTQDVTFTSGMTPQDLQQMQQYATIITEQEARASVNGDNQAFS